MRKKKKKQERDKGHARVRGWSGEGDKRSILKGADRPSFLFFSSESFLLNEPNCCVSPSLCTCQTEDIPFKNIQICPLR